VASPRRERPLSIYAVVLLLGIALVTVFALTAGSRALTSLGDSREPTEPRPTATATASAPNDTLVVTDLVVGTGEEAKSGDLVKANYVGTFPDGREFDSSKKQGKPHEFRLGKGQVIKGWDEGVVGMKVGGTRKLVVPPSLAYGARGSPPFILPNATLVFEIELVAVAHPQSGGR
jgi:FKBP-type peptidyl-prolyl cis-trans isomerase FkpA